MRDKGELHTICVSEGAGDGMDIEIPRPPLMLIPLNVIGLGIDNVRFTNIMIPIDPQDNLQIDLDTERNVETDSAPAKIKLLIEVVDPHERAAQIPVHRYCICLLYTSRCV